MKLKIVVVDWAPIADWSWHTSGLHFIHEYAERQAQLPRTGAETLE